MKKIKQHLLLLSILVLANTSFAQTEKTGAWCLTDEHNEALIKQNPLLKEQQRLHEDYVLDYIKNNPEIQSTSTTANRTPVFIIPVVFHIITFNGQGNVSKQDIDNAMLTLNEDFQRLNSDASQTLSVFAPFAADAQVEFRLAHKDPNGNCTEGIVRVESPLSVDAGNSIKNVSRWDTRKYLNIWSVVNIGGAPNGGGIIAGFAQFPSSGINNSYGIVVDHRFVNRSDRTISHEMGHCFGLFHIFQGGCSNNGATGGDGVTDTPPAAQESFNCALTNNTCSNVPSGDPYGTNAVDPVQNFMSYNSCQNFFTLGQKARMNANLNNTSVSTGLKQLSNASNLVFTGTNNPYGPTNCAPIADFNFNRNMICEGSNVTYTDNSYNGIPTSFSWTFTGGTPATSTLPSPTITYNTLGTYGTTYQPASSGGAGIEVKNNIITVSSLTADYSGIIVDGFESPTQFANDWIIIDESFGQKFQRTTSAFASGSAAVEIRNFFTNFSGRLKDELISPSYDLSTVSSPILRFKVAHASKTNANDDRLFVWWSLDCGQTWFLRLPLTKATLRTTTNKPSFWTPTASEWEEKTVDLSSIANETNVRFKFVFESGSAINGSGNNLYLDDINIDGITSVKDLDENISSFSVYPNPTNSSAVISFNLNKEISNLNISIKDILGKNVSTIINGQSFVKGKYTLAIDEQQQLNSGVYFIVFNADNNVITQKLIIQ